MWQRIQTLWLLLAGVAMTLVLVYPMALFTKSGLIGSENFEMTSIWLRNIFTGQKETILWGLFALDVLIVVFSFLTIFLFKNRKLQMRVCMFTLLLSIGFIGYVAFLAFGFVSSLEASFSFKFAIALPIITPILLFLAYQGIRKDYILVRISNRIR